MKKTIFKKTFATGTEVQWNWMGRPVRGTIKKVFLKPVTKVFRGTTFSRNGSPEKPAYLVQSEKGSDVLKSQTELKPVRRQYK